MNIKISADLEKSMGDLAKAWGLSIGKTVELILIGTMARKAVFGDVLDQPEPGIEKVTKPDGTILEGQELYQSVYEQTKAWLNALLLAEKLLELLAKEKDQAELKDPKLNIALQFYRDKKDYVN